MPDWIDEEFTVQCFHCRGKKGRTTKRKGKTWAFCPNCGASLDIMNRVCDICGKQMRNKSLTVTGTSITMEKPTKITVVVCSEKCKNFFEKENRLFNTIAKIAGE